MSNTRIRHFETVESTNSLALAAREEGAVFWADAQTAGRGQHGKRWESAAAKGLWFSVCYSGAAQGLQFAAALAVRDTLLHWRPAHGNSGSWTGRPCYYTSVTVKWPNDILLNGKKICGILVEHSENWNAVGIGLNVLHVREDFPEELRDTASSLFLETGLEWERETLLHEMVQSLDHWVGLLRSGQYARVFAEWAAACDIVGRDIERDGLRGRVVALEEDGALRVETEAGPIRIDSGCVHIVAQASPPA